jgi:hypothetical protein
MERNTLNITVVSSGYIGRCYTETVFRVKSNCQLSSRNILALRSGGFLGYGQEFTMSEILPDGVKSPVVEQTDWRRNGQAQYIYECIDRCDSSD